MYIKILLSAAVPDQRFKMQLYTSIIQSFQITKNININDKDFDFPVLTRSPSWTTNYIIRSYNKVNCKQVQEMVSGAEAGDGC